MLGDLRVKRLDPNAKLIQKAHPDDLGYDLFALETVTIKPDAGVVGVRTGIAVEFPPFIGAVIKDRSSIAKIGVVTAAGVIDSGYRGEIVVLMYNVGQCAFSIHAGAKIAQMILTPVLNRYVEEEEQELATSDRGTQGFGSTGK